MLDLIPVVQRNTPSFGEVQKSAKYHVIMQQNEEDCGPACLASIAKFYGRIFTINRLRDAVGTGQTGTTLLGLKQGAESVGFNVRTVRASPDILKDLDTIPLPAIIHWQGYHWVVFYGKQGKKFVIADPGVGLLYLTEKELLSAWTNGVMLLLEPDPDSFFLEPDDRANVPTITRWLRRSWAYRRVISEAFLINIVLGLLSISSPFLLQILTDDVLVRGDTQLLANVATAVIIMTGLSNALELIQSNLISHFAQHLELGLVLEFGRKILHLPLSYYETRRSGEIISRLKDIQEINSLISQVVISLPSQTIIALVSLGFMLFYSPILTLVALLITLAMTGSTLFFLPTLQQKTRQLLALEAETQGVLVETFKGALTLKATGSAGEFWQELQGRFGRLANLSFKTTQIGINNNIFSGLVGGVGNIALLWFGSSLVIGQSLSIGQLLAFMSMSQNVVGWMNRLVGFIDELTRVQTATQRLSEVIDGIPETKGDTKKPWVKLAPRADIICKDVNFHYPGRVDLITNFSVTLPGGKAIALIGKSGCGKSTLAKLIAGLYPLPSGNIRFGMYNLGDLALDCLRHQVVLVPQETHLWSRSIIDNLCLGLTDVKFTDIVRACQIVGADDFISKLPDKYQTVLGEFGANLSGGQRQRLALARAVISDPPVLILDEATASLDPVSETELLERLLNYRRGKTTIFISHRPQVINMAHWVVLLEDGMLKLDGTVRDLQAKSGHHLDFLNV